MRGLQVWVIAAMALPCRAQCFETKLEPANSVFDAQFSTSMAVRDGRVAVGAPMTDRVHVFTQDAGDWHETQILQPAPAPQLRGYGVAVSLGPGLLAVGAHLDSDVVMWGGSATVFEFDGQLWRPGEVLRASDGAPLDNFGYSLAFSPNGRFLAIGAPMHDVLQSSDGAVYVFERVAGGWLERQILGPGPGYAGARFGSSVELSNDTLVVSSPLIPPLFAGAVHVFEFNAQSGSWIQVQELAQSNPTGNDNFGWSISLEGELLLIGAHGWNGNAGAAYLYSRGASAWNLEHTFHGLYQFPWSGFGYSVELLGDEALIYGNDLDITVPGAGVIYHWRSTRLGWEIAERLPAPEPEVDLAFGSSIAKDGQTVLFGTTWPTAASPAGAAYMYEFSRTDRYCPASANSSGEAGSIEWGGTTLLRQNRFRLMASGCPASVPGVFFFGDAETQQTFGNGTRCVGGQVVRLPVVTTDPAGTVEQAVDTFGPGYPLSSGGSWHFQFWFRDPPAGGSAFDLSDAIRIEFCF